DIRKKTKVASVICCALVLGAYAELRRLPPVRADQPFIEDWPGSVRASLMLRALGDYGRLMVFPANLHMERTIFDPDNYRDRASWRRSAALEYLSISGLIVLAAFIYGCARPRNGRRLRILGAIWFFAAYLPISNIVLLNATVNMKSPKKCYATFSKSTRTIPSREIILLAFSRTKERRPKANPYFRAASKRRGNRPLAFREAGSQPLILRRCAHEQTTIREPS